MTDKANTGGAGGWINATPTVWAVPAAQRTIRAVLLALRRLKAEVPSPAQVDAIRTAGLASARKLRSSKAVDLVFCLHVFCDLRAQGWKLRCSKSRVSALAPANGLDATLEKARVRAAHEVDRDQQLRQPAVQRFVRDMERRKLYKGEWHSIFSLMRDGAALSSQLAAAATDSSDQGPVALQRAIDPYVQAAPTGAQCEFTGLDLFDVWRYFRHTWTTTYQSTPGRKLFFLIRDRAARLHPVIGIAALGSPIVQLTVRDEWIGWTLEQLLERMANDAPAAWRLWAQNSLEALIDGIYVDDFIKEGHLRRTDLVRPTAAVLDRLRGLSQSERAQHRLYPQRKQHKRAPSTAAERWTSEARTHLFRSKRAGSLAELLRARLNLSASDLMTCAPSAWRTTLLQADVRQALATIVRHVKATHVGVDVMDITVCGAVAPYSHVLGGKLVALLMASPEVRREYHRRYRHAESIIASSMAGRPVVRRPKLVLLGTTGLYSVAPSQYNRLRMPLGDGEHLSYERLGQTVGYGSYHFSQATIAALEPLLSRLQSGRPVNSIFGEGVNPKLRKVRAALDVVGLPSNLLMQHGSPRVVYGVPLARNFKDMLLGVNSRADYLLSDGPESSQAIVAHWRERWLRGRIRNEDVLRSVASHRVAGPVHHGARVPLPANAGGAGAVELSDAVDDDRWPLLTLLAEDESDDLAAAGHATSSRKSRSRRSG
jgi:hypothetical protein